MHQQVRLSPALSPPDLARVLEIVADAGINIVAVGGSNLEHGGEFAFSVEDDATTQKVVDLLRSKGYKPRLADVELFWLTNQPGQLLAKVREVAAGNKASGKAIQDIAIGPPGPDGRVRVEIYSARRG
jgi:hypothetical protein